MSNEADSELQEKRSPGLTNTTTKKRLHLLLSSSQYVSFPGRLCCALKFVFRCASQNIKFVATLTWKRATTKNIRINFHVYAKLIFLSIASVCVCIFVYLLFQLVVVIVVLCFVYQQEQQQQQQNSQQPNEKQTFAKRKQNCIYYIKFEIIAILTMYLMYL